MKIGIITLVLSNNFGAALQTLALSRVLKDTGAIVEVYNYHNLKRIHYGMSFAKRIKHGAYNVLSWILCFGNRKRRFEAFRKKYIPLTSQVYKTCEDLKSNPGEYDIYLTGSDQVWNPGLFIFDYSYFFDFIPKGKIKISYGPSFGKAGFDEKYKKKCGELLSDYKYISVRESSGVDIVRELCEKEAVCVLDPTLLLGMIEWKEYANDASEASRNFNGILCYIMPGDLKVENAIEEIAQQLHKKNGLPIMRLGIKEVYRFKYPHDETDIGAGPAEFLSYFLGAGYVVTNSFHGTAFSANFGKKFYVPINKTLPKENALHERILSLLDAVGAMNHVVDADNAKLPCDDFSDSDSIRSQLDIEVEKSKEYLRKAIGATNDK